MENPKIREVLHKISVKESSVNNLVIVYGKMTQEIILSTVKLIERKLMLENFTRGYITKVKMIGTEIMQNISKHQQYSDEVAPYFILNADNNGLHLYSGNLISDESKDYLSKNLTQYKLLNKAELRAIYSETFLNTSLTKEGNAGLGLLTIVYKSEQNITHDLVQLSNGAYHYSLEVFLNATLNKN